MKFPQVTLKLPAWVGEFFAEDGREYPTAEDRMSLAVELSRLNVRHGTGGPFGAAVFDRSTNRLVAPGVNLVVSEGCATFHAEMVAIMVSQRLLGSFDLGGAEGPAYELATSAEPCAMCLGAVPWSGVRHLSCAARGEDAEAIGFDEGEKPPGWPQTLEKRGISVSRDVLREEAGSVLREYAEKGGVIYNGRQSS